MRPPCAAHAPLVADVAIVAKGLGQFVAEQNLAGGSSCAELFDRFPKLLHLDNKWVPRRNPIVFALHVCPRAHVDQRLAALRDRDGYVRRVVDYFAAKYFEECIPLEPEKHKQW